MEYTFNIHDCLELVRSNNIFVGALDVNTGHEIHHWGFMLITQNHPDYLAKWNESSMLQKMIESALCTGGGVYGDKCKFEDDDAGHLYFYILKHSEGILSVKCKYDSTYRTSVNVYAVGYTAPPYDCVLDGYMLAASLNWEDRKTFDIDITQPVRVAADSKFLEML